MQKLGEERGGVKAMSVGRAPYAGLARPGKHGWLGPAVGRCPPNVVLITDGICKRQGHWWWQFPCRECRRKDLGLTAGSFQGVSLLGSETHPPPVAFRTSFSFHSDS